MSATELALCLSAVLTGSISQLFIKGASTARARPRAWTLLGTGAVLLGGSVLLAVLAMRSVPLSQMVTFAAGAYVLVPLGSRLVFEERLIPRFWLGTVFILAGIAWINT